ncbi:MAG: ABC transporter ATP-binding protein [Nitrospinota bacterium]|nr:ABC transporter ATP-binding protein [Nitrospinota bacterium]
MIDLRDIKKTYQREGAPVEALRGVSVSIASGDYVALMGKSGSGKTTLMNIIGLLDTPTDGEYRIDDRPTAGLSEDELAILRNRRIGFVFQSFNLLARYTALENVCMPLYYRRERYPQKKATQALERVDLGHRISHFPNQLSGGESQRVAIARALVTEPAIILADEPTGNLDSATGAQIMGLFQELNKGGTTILLVTHEPEIAKMAERIIRIRDGLLV